MADLSLKKVIPLKKFPLWRQPRTRRPGQITALEVDGPVLRVVQASPRGQRIVVTCVEAGLLEFPADADPSNAQVLGAAIAQTLAKLNLKPSVVVMGIPRALVMLRTLSLPALGNLREMASMVHFQIGKDLPFRMEEAVIDFKVRRPLIPVPSEAQRPETEVKPGETVAGKPTVEILVAAVKRDVVTFHEQTAAAAGLKLQALGLLSYAHARCLEACRIASGEEAVALVSLQADAMHIDVIVQQTLLFSRGAKMKPFQEAARADSDAPGTAVAEPVLSENFARTITIEVVRSLHSYSGMEPNRPVAKIAVTGATGHEGVVVASLAERLGRPCTLLDLTVALELPPESRQHTTGSIASIGMALGWSDPAGLPFDFLNPKKPAVVRDMGRIRLLAGAMAAVLVLIMTLSIRSYLITKHEKVRLALAAEVADAEKKSPLYRRMVRQVAVVDQWTKNGRNWLDHYAYLTAILPPSEEFYTTSLSVNGSGAIRLTIQSRSGEILARLEKQLRAAGYNVKPLAITPGADRHGYEFRSSVELIVPDKMKMDLTKVKAPARPADDGSLDPLTRKGGGK